MKILIIEDDPNILSVLIKGLEEDNNVIDSSQNGLDGEYLASSNQYDVIILDWMLPQKNGIEILQSLRSKRIDTPILMLTAKDEDANKIEGLQIGSDDYLTKPFSFGELRARLYALHRRFQNNYDSNTITLKDLLVDIGKKKVYKSNKEVKLSAKEIGILLLLIENKNNFVSKSMIEEYIYNTEQYISSNVVSVTIHNLRKKIGNDIIQNFRGLGYKIEI